MKKFKLQFIGFHIQSLNENHANAKAGNRLISRGNYLSNPGETLQYSFAQITNSNFP
jgi:hypothetical protein